MDRKEWKLSLVNLYKIIIALIAEHQIFVIVDEMWGYYVNQKKKFISTKNLCFVSTLKMILG